MKQERLIIKMKNTYSERIFDVKKSKTSVSYKNNVEKLTRTINAYRRRKGDNRKIISQLRDQRTSYIDKIRRLSHNETVNFYNVKGEIVKTDKITKVSVNHILEEDQTIRVRVTLLTSIGSDLIIDDKTGQSWLTVSGEGLNINDWFELKGVDKNQYIVHNAFIVKSTYRKGK